MESFDFSSNCHRFIISIRGLSFLFISFQFRWWALFDYLSPKALQTSGFALVSAAGLAADCSAGFAAGSTNILIDERVYWSITLHGIVPIQSPAKGPLPFGLTNEIIVSNLIEIFRKGLAKFELSHRSSIFDKKNIVCALIKDYSMKSHLGRRFHIRS